MKEIIQTDEAPKAIGPYSQAVKSGNFLFISGQIPLDPLTMNVVGQTAAQQAEQVLENIGAILRAAGLDYADIVKTTVLLADINDFKAVNEVYGGFFRQEPPARAAYQAAALPMGVLVEIEAVAAC